MFENLKKQLVQNAKLKNTPCIPESVYEELPEPLKECCSKFEKGREKDYFLTSALAILSGCLPNLQGDYGKDKIYANLMGLIGAPPASGKGVMKFAQMLGGKIHETLLEKGKLELSVSAGYSFENVEQTLPQEIKPPRAMLYIPANTSAAMFIEHLKDNNGWGIICESEADTLVNALKQDWGDFSDQLRKSFHHEPISNSRKMDKAYCEIKCPRVSMIVTGTPDQIKNLVPSAENGLFSRIFYYVSSNSTGWKSNAPCTDCDNNIDFFKRKSEEIFKLALFHNQNPMTFSFSLEQWQIINQYFTDKFDLVSTSHGDEAQAVLKRMGINMFRFAMVLSALSNQNIEDISTINLVCTEINFNIAMALVETYLAHSLVMLEIIPKSLAKDYVGIAELFFSKLPDVFRRSQAVEIGKRLEISPRSVDRRLSQLVKNAKFQQVSAGIYKKK